MVPCWIQSLPVVAWRVTRVYCVPKHPASAQSLTDDLRTEAEGRPWPLVPRTSVRHRNIYTAQTGRRRWPDSGHRPRPPHTPGTAPPRAHTESCSCARHLPAARPKHRSNAIIHATPTVLPTRHTPTARGAADGAPKRNQSSSRDATSHQETHGGHCDRSCRDDISCDGCDDLTGVTSSGEAPVQWCSQQSTDHHSDDIQRAAKRNNVNKWVRRELSYQAQGSQRRPQFSSK